MTDIELDLLLYEKAIEMDERTYCGYYWSQLKLRQLIKKKEILIHARLTMEKSYINKIDKQKRYINELNSSLNELNKEIKLLSE